MQVKTTPPLSSRALEEGVAIHKKARKRLDCDVAKAPRNDDCGWANYMHSIALTDNAIVKDCAVACKKCAEACRACQEDCKKCEK